MKLTAPIIIAFLLGAVAMSLGWGDAIYTALVFFGFISLIILGVVVWTLLSQQKTQSKAESSETSNEQRRD